jgi:3-deoxy-7-phosphoheptulonate synthase
MIDMSHANSFKDHRQQLRVADDICGQLRDAEPRILGVMIESNIEEGSQKIGPPGTMVYGRSVTDACIGWDDTVGVLDRLAAASAARMTATVAA